jgi:hypothetical protein
MERKCLSSLTKRRYAQISIKVLFHRYREESHSLKAYSKKDFLFHKHLKDSISNSQPQNSSSKNIKKLGNSSPKNKRKTDLNLSLILIGFNRTRFSQLMGTKNYNNKFIPLSHTINR